MAPKTAEKKNQNKKGQQQQQQGTKQDKKVIEWGGRYGAVTGHVLAILYTSLHSNSGLVNLKIISSAKLYNMINT